MCLPLTGPQKSGDTFHTSQTGWKLQKKSNKTVRGIASVHVHHTGQALVRQHSHCVFTQHFSPAHLRTFKRYYWPMKFDIEGIQFSPQKSECWAATRQWIKHKALFDTYPVAPHTGEDTLHF